MTAVQPSGRAPDLAGLEGIRRQASTAPEAAVEGLARQFEAVLIQMMLESMRQALPGGGASGGAQAGFNHDMLDTQLALTLSRQGGLGLADMLETQLARSLPRSQSPADGEIGPAQMPVDGALRPARPVAAAAEAAPPVAPPEVGALPQRAQSEVAAPQATAAPTDGPAFDSPAAFVTGLWDAAQASAARLGVSAELLIAQAAHETGWGRSIPRLPDGRSSHNLFGIKAGSTWDGQRVVQSTVEVVDGVAVREKAAFRAYDSFADAFADYAALVTTSPRYEAALARADSPAGYLTQLQAGGYATNPHYADRVLGVLEGPTLRESLAALKDPPSRPI